MPIMQTEQLTKDYGNQTAVNALDLTLERGQLTAYLGTNGAGKSTTILMMTGTLTPTSGRVLYQGEDIALINPKQFKIGVVFQESILDEELTVRMNLQLRGQMYEGVTKAAIEQLMVRTDIAAYADQRYGNLSGGMKRKVDITRALINQPTVLFLDEPTAGLDVQAREDIWRLLNHLKTTQQLAIFLTTHYIEEANEADQVYVLNAGEIVEQGSAQSLKATHGGLTLWLQVANMTKIQADYGSQLLTDEHKGIGIRVGSAQEALRILTTYQDVIDDFSYQPVDMTAVFLKLTGGRTNECDDETKPFIVY